MHCDLKGESLELVACTMTKGIKFSSFFLSFFFFSFVYIFFLGGGIVSKIRLSIFDSSFKSKLQMPRGIERQDI